MTARHIRRPRVYLAFRHPRRFAWCCTNGHIAEGYHATMDEAAAGALSHLAAFHPAGLPVLAPMTAAQIEAWRAFPDVRRRRAVAVHDYVATLRKEQQS